MIKLKKCVELVQLECFPVYRNDRDVATGFRWLSRVAPSVIYNSKMCLPRGSDERWWVATRLGLSVIRPNQSVVRVFERARLVHDPRNVYTCHSEGNRIIEALRTVRQWKSNQSSFAIALAWLRFIVRIFRAGSEWAIQRPSRTTNYAFDSSPLHFVRCIVLSVRMGVFRETVQSTENGTRTIILCLATL